MSTSNIGQLNGPWSLLFRIACVLTPLIAAGGAWATVNIIEIRSSRFTSEDGRRIWEAHYELAQTVAARDVPQWILDRMERQDDRMERIEAKLDTLLENTK